MFEVELTPEDPVEKIVDISKHAEKEGFDAAWITDHYNNRNSFVVLSMIANSTKKINLGPGVTNPYYIHPAWMASAVATLDEISGGRARLGIGAGDINTLSSIGIERENPLKQVREAVESIRDILEEKKLNYETSSFPVYIGAQGSQMLRMAGDIGDGVLINASHPDDIKWSLEKIGKTEAELVAYISFSIDYEREKARDEARQPVAFVASGSSMETLNRHGIDSDIAKKIGEKIEKSNFREAFSLVTEKMLDSFSVSGSPQECKEKIERILDTRIDKVVIGSPLGPNPKESLSIASDMLNL